MNRSWVRAAVLLAWRQAGRQRARSVAMVLILALPVAGISAFDVVCHSTHLSAADDAGWLLGLGADAVLDWVGYPVEQPPNPAATTVSVPTDPDQGIEPAPASPPSPTSPRAPRSPGRSTPSRY